MPASHLDLLGTRLALAFTRASKGRPCNSVGTSGSGGENGSGENDQFLLVFSSY